MDYPWIIEAKKHIGLKEIPGPKHNPTILGWLKSLKAWWVNDETPWCGVLIAQCFNNCGLRIPKLWMRAKEWSNGWGVQLPDPIAGCVVVFDRAGGGHVGFVLGRTADNFIVVLGGNQSNMVSIAKFDKSRVVGYYWPRDYALPNTLAGMTTQLPIVAVTGGVSVNEA